MKRSGLFQLRSCLKDRKIKLKDNMIVFKMINRRPRRRRRRRRKRREGEK